MDEEHPPVNHSQPTLVDVLALAGYVVLVLVFTWPLVTRLGSHAIGPFRGDNFEYVWKMWWVPHALFEERISPFFNPDMYYPYGYWLAYGELTPAHTFLLAPLTLAVGEVAAYNLAILLSGVLSGWFTYRLALRWLGDQAGLPRLARRAGAFFAGVAFAFSAYRMQRIAGHLPLVGTQWLVLALLALDRWLEARRWRDAALTGLAASLAALSSWYYAVMLLLLMPVYVLAGGSNLPALLRARRTWASGALLAGVAAALCVPFLLPYLHVAAEGQATIPLADASFWAASPLDYLLPNPRHPLWGPTVQRLMWPLPGADMPVEFAAVPVGWVTLLLAVWAWRQVRGRHWRALKWVIGTAFVLSLGPILHLGRLPLGVPLPVMALRLLPVLNGIRSWGRFSVFVTLGASLLAGAGLAAAVQAAGGRQRWLVAGGLTAALLFGAWTGPAGLVEVGPRPVDTWLASQPGEFAIMQFPVQVALSGPSVYYTRHHGKPVTFGYGTYFPFLFRQRHPELDDFPSVAALDTLHAWHVRYVLVDTSHLDGAGFTLADVDAQPRLRHIMTLGDQAVYELVR